ncbi:hypothetical protein Trydic_g4848 [Trypoxylus dichotomus]
MPVSSSQVKRIKRYSRPQKNNKFLGLSVQQKEVLKHTTFLNSYEIDVVDTGRTLLVRFADSALSNENQMQAKDQRVNGFFTNATGLPINYQIKGEKMNLSNRKSQLRKLYNASRWESSEEDESNSTESASPMTQTEKPSSELDDTYYYPEKFHALKEQLGILRQVILKRNKMIESLNDMVKNLHERRKHLKPAF